MHMSLLPAETCKQIQRHAQLRRNACCRLRLPGPHCASACSVPRLSETLNWQHKSNRPAACGSGSCLMSMHGVQGIVIRTDDVSACLPVKACRCFRDPVYQVSYEWVAGKWNNGAIMLFWIWHTKDVCMLCCDDQPDALEVDNQCPFPDIYCCRVRSLQLQQQSESPLRRPCRHILS